MLDEAERQAAGSGQGIEVAFARFERALQETKPLIFVQDYMAALDAICLHLAYVEAQSAEFARLHGLSREAAVAEAPSIEDSNEPLKAQWLTVFRKSA